MHEIGNVDPLDIYNLIDKHFDELKKCKNHSSKYILTGMCNTHPRMAFVDRMIFDLAREVLPSGEENK